jgi:phage-related protein
MRMSGWTFFDYVEITGRNPIRDWLDGLPEEDSAKIDYRLRQMAGMTTAVWPEGWVSKYRGTEEIFELRISGNRVKYRPLGTYYGLRQFIILAGAIEKGWRIPRSDIDTATRRLSNVHGDSRHARLHQYDGDETLEDDAE